MDGVPPVENRVLTVGSERVVYVEHRYVNNREVCLRVLTGGFNMSSGGSRISQRKGCQPQTWGSTYYFGQNFHENCMKIYKLDPVGVLGTAPYICL